MTLILLIRHAQNEWVRSGRLAGWTPGVHLNEKGRRQAEALGERLASANLRAIYSSPLERAVETAEAIAQHYPDLTVTVEEGIGEVDYGGWTGMPLRKLRRRRLWKVVQRYPSNAVFPDGEGLREMQFRAVSAIERIVEQHPTGPIAIVAHADVIRVVFAHYAGIHLDLFQRLVISPASITTLALQRMGPYIIRMNDTSHYEQAKNNPHAAS